MCADMSIRFELDATAAQGILTGRALPKVRHIDVNCLWLQEQCAKKMVPLNKIPGEENTAGLMTKHLAIATIFRHTKKLNLVHTGGRADAAAKLHLVSESQIPIRTTGRLSQIIDPKPKKSIKDYWAERSEHGRWVRVHIEPRTGRFYPWRAPTGPGRKSRLHPTRRTQGIFSDGGNFDTNDDWQLEKDEQEKSPWTGKTIFIVDHRYSKEYGTDQRRQRETIENRPKASA